MNRRTPTPTAERRRRDLAAIHAAVKQIGMTEDAYRALVANIAAECGLPPTQSSGDLTPQARASLLDRMRQLGGNRARSARAGQHPGKPHNLDREPMLQKIEAQLAELGAAWAYADSIAMHMYRVQRVAWLRREDHLRAVIAALYQQIVKRRTLAFIDETLARVGWNDEALRQRLPDLRRDWRNVRAQRMAVANLFGASPELLQAEAEEGQPT